MNRLARIARRIVLCASVLALVPIEARGQFTQTLDMFLFRRDAIQEDTWAQVPFPPGLVNFSWWLAPGPTPVCEYNTTSGIIIAPQLHCVTSRGGVFNFVVWPPTFPNDDNATIPWLTQRAIQNPPLWPNPDRWPLSPFFLLLNGIGRATATFDSTSPEIEFKSVNTFLTLDAVGNEIMNYQFSTAPVEPSVVPEPASAVLVASGLLAMAAFSVRRRCRTP